MKASKTVALAGNGMPDAKPSQPQFDNYDLNNHIQSLNKAGKAQNPEADMHTLVHAHKIMKNKKRHGAAKAQARKMAGAMAAVGGAGGEPDADDMGGAPGM